MASDTPRPHPLDQITKEEIENAARIIKENKQKILPPVEFTFNSMINLEPPKKQLLPLLRSGGDLSKINRKSLIVVEEKGTANAFQIIVNHDQPDRPIEKLSGAGGRKASLTADDISSAEIIGKNDSTVRQRLRDEYNVTDMKMVTADIWTFGYNGEGPDDAPFNKLRVVNAYFYFRRDDTEDNAYAHPVGFIAIIDLPGMKVLQIKDLPTQSGFGVDSKTNFKVPNKKDNYLPKFIRKDYYRKDIKPYVVTQPEGPSFTIKNKYEISWQKFNFRISFNYRTGLVFHYINYNCAHDHQTGLDGDEERGTSYKGEFKPKRHEILYQAGLSEMVVPYGDPRPPYHRKSAFDMGEYGMGLNANSLEMGCDCIGHVEYFDFHYTDQDGNAKTIKKVVCLHEEDAGLLTKHTEYRTNKAYLTRSRRLVVSFICTVTNYEYLFYWYFYQDGTITHEIKASGELSTNLLADKATPGGWGTIEFPLINGQFHQHIFCVRMDFILDGENNTAAMLDVVRTEGNLGSPQNPYANGFTVKKTEFNRAKDAITDTDTKLSRVWIVQNDSIKNQYSNTPVAWKLMPGTGAFAGLLAGETSYIRKRAGFAAHSFWVTPYKDDELYAAGFYINQSKGNEGVEVWANRNENIKNTDIVVWHTFGLTHIPRVEDFPIMPVEGCGFSLKPYNFFHQNPGLDIPPPMSCYKMVRDCDNGEMCHQCWSAERRSASTITCRHKDLILEREAK